MWHAARWRLLGTMLCAGLVVAAQAGYADVVGYWPFDEGSGQAVTDHSSNGNNGVLGTTSDVETCDPEWRTGPPCLYFNQDEWDCVTVQHSDSLSIAGPNAAVSLECYIRPARVGATATPSQMLIWKGVPNPGGPVNYYLEMRTPTGSSTGIRFGLLDSNGTWRYLDYGGCIPLAGYWYFVAASYDSGDSQNGNCKIVVQREGQAAGSVSGTIVATMVANSYSLSIGRLWDDPDDKTGFHGRMREVRIYRMDPAAVEVAGLAAVRSGNLMRIVWEALGLPDVLGYNVLRRDPSASAWTRANSAMILPEGGAMYHARLAFADQRARAGAEYRLEAVRADGSSGVYEVPKLGQ